MSLTAADVRAVVFRRASLGKRGYEEEDVDSFLDLVEQELERSSATPAGPPPAEEARRPAAVEQPAGTVVDNRLQAIRLLQAAEETADRVIREAEIESARLVRGAQVQSDILLSDAQERAANSDRECRARATAIEAQAQASNQSMLGGLADKRTKLLHEITELEQYRLSLHRQLRQWLGDQLARVADGAARLADDGTPAAVDAAA